MRLHLRHLTSFPCLEPEHVSSNKSRAYPHSGNGLHVRCETPPIKLQLTHNYSASVAVVVRMAFVMDFKNPDFLYATVDIAIWSDIETGLAITAGSLATLRPLFRLLGSRLGFNSTGNTPSASKPTRNRTQQWKGAPRASDGLKKPFFNSLTSSLFRNTEKGTVLGRDDEYGMGDLQPMRLRDDLVDETVSEKSDKGFNTWKIHAGKKSDEEHRAGTITRHQEISQHEERL